MSSIMRCRSGLMGSNAGPNGVGYEEWGRRVAYVNRAKSPIPDVMT
jgi:hypothetical protein